MQTPDKVYMETTVGRKPKTPIKIHGPIAIKSIRALLDAGFLPIIASHIK